MTEQQKELILVVDDNESNRDLLNRQLRRRGFDVLLAEDGESGLEVVEKEAIDLVILDIMMPGIDGFEVLRRLRESHTPAELPIIMATAKNAAEDIVQSAELGANDHVGKPFDFDVLAAKVKALLKLRSAARPKTTGEPGLNDLRPGSVVAKKYRLVEPIGSGNFGHVYKAVHEGLEQDIALKILKPELTASPDALERFRREGVAACRVHHPNAVTISDFGVTESGVAFLAMELLKGEDLKRELRRSGVIAPLRVKTILRPVCEVLAEAHAHDLVHRDVKPENVFLHRTNRGEIVKVLDFGIAKQVGEASLQENLTTEGWIIGTMAYMAPERFTGKPYGGSADVYALGVLLFEMLTGQRPFKAAPGDPLSLIGMHAEKTPPALRSCQEDLPEELEEPVAWALAKQPEDRPTPLALADAFERAVSRVEDREEVSPDAETLDLDSPLTEETNVQEGVFGRWFKKSKT